MARPLECGIGFRRHSPRLDRSRRPLGEPITINTVQGPVSGTYQGLSETGALRAEVNGNMREFSHGDVALGEAPTHDGAA